jgi:hypothetical protein
MEGGKVEEVGVVGTEVERKPRLGGRGRECLDGEETRCL